MVDFYFERRENKFVGMLIPTWTSGNQIRPGIVWCVTLRIAQGIWFLDVICFRYRRRGVCSPWLVFVLCEHDVHCPIAIYFLIFYQSRISEGWPAILYYHGRLGVVKDPISRQFLFVSPSIVKTASPTVLKPNKKAVAIELDTRELSENDKFLLQQAIWPSEDKLIALSYFKKRENICSAIADVLKRKRNAKAGEHTQPSPAQ